MTDTERFWSKVDKTRECWIWTGAVSRERTKGRFWYKGKSEWAHRVAWEITYGPAPRGYAVKQRCGTSLCVNPKHLFVGRQRSPLSVADIWKIRREYSEDSSIAQRELGVRYGVSCKTIGYIVNRKNWAGV